MRVVKCVTSTIQHELSAGSVLATLKVISWSFIQQFFFSFLTPNGLQKLSLLQWNFTSLSNPNWNCGLQVHPCFGGIHYTFKFPALDTINVNTFVKTSSQ
eukprot:TRINITY_DN10036_c3_g1_i1.p2 TRINITY_DN10036_c3_g1~~TRINITY_DN10036_c3_g1_i1.p2  ORF type:complete len:100 (-),score=3.29 TRINITY_DN10036_c3_g1_i1:1119-1418(-)